MGHARQAGTNSWARRSGTLVWFCAWLLGTALFAANLLAFVTEAPPRAETGGAPNHGEPARTDHTRPDVLSWPAPAILPVLPEGAYGDN